MGSGRRLTSRTDPHRTRGTTVAAPRAQGAVQRPRVPGITSPRTGAPGRTAASRGTAPRPRPATGRRPAPPRRKPPKPARRRTDGRHWLHRLGVVAGATLAIVTALGALEPPPTEAVQTPAAPTGSAAATAATLTDAVARYRAALADATGSEDVARQERAAATTAQVQAAAEQAAVGEWATALYQRSTAERWPLA